MPIMVKFFIRLIFIAARNTKNLFAKLSTGDKNLEEIFIASNLFPNVKMLKILASAKRTWAFKVQSIRFFFSKTTQPVLFIISILAPGIVLAINLPSSSGVILSFSPQTISVGDFIKNKSYFKFSIITFLKVSLRLMFL